MRKPGSGLVKLERDIVGAPRLCKGPGEPKWKRRESSLLESTCILRSYPRAPHATTRTALHILIEDYQNRTRRSLSSLSVFRAETPSSKYGPLVDLFIVLGPL